MYLLLLPVNNLLLCATHLKSGGRHALAHTTFRHKLTVALLHERRHGLVDHVAEAYGDIGHLLVIPF